MIGSPARVQASIADSNLRDPHPALAKMPLNVGDSNQLSIAIAPGDVRRFAELSGDTAALHTDEEFARRHGFEGCLVHGGLLIALVSRFVGTTMPGPSAVLERVDVAFRQPCYAPCAVVIQGSVRQVSEAVSTIVLDIVITSAGATVATGRTWHKLLEAPTT
jgi:acyl dehydratase